MRFPARRPAVRRALLPALAALALARTAAAGCAGGVFEISGSDCRFPDVAWSAASGDYLVVWADYGRGGVFGRFIRLRRVFPLLTSRAALIRARIRGRIRP